MEKRFENILSEALSSAVFALYDLEIKPSEIIIQKTRKEFEGDFTVTVFPFIKKSGKSPEITGDEIGKNLLQCSTFLSAYNVVKGFLNITVSQDSWCTFFTSCLLETDYGFVRSTFDSDSVMLEYSSPNTNKPLHLGHVRNNLLGFSVSKILEANGKNVIKVNLVNDRGIHICKSMLAWQKFGNNETPASSGLKGDHFVGKYYVEFDRNYKQQVNQLQQQGISKEEAEKNAPLMLEIQEMLRKWESGDQEIIALWKMMNSWVYEGFAKTYSLLGVHFDKMYYESNTYLLGKNIVDEGLTKSVFYKKDDGSVWIDLTAEGLDHKVVLRADGTSVYITQDIGTAIERFREYPQVKKLIYTVGNEQDYHFKVLFHILDKLGYQWAKECFHLSYGMVELPEGKMKSREGTVVDADDLIGEMILTATTTTKELGKVDGLTEQEAETLFQTIGMGALKYFILKVDPKKKMLFDPKESIDFNGNTGPFIQYTYARIQSLLRKSSFNAAEISELDFSFNLQTKEIELIKLIYEFPAIIREAGKCYSPALIANFAYELAKSFNQYYHDTSIIKEEDEKLRYFRINLSYKIACLIKQSMNLLGIEVPNRM